MIEPISNQTYESAMRQALRQARLASEHEDVPVGAVLIDGAGTIVAEDHNRREEANDPTAHAEILVLSRRSRDTGTWRLGGHTLVVTLEPCAMCAGAAVLARIDRIVYGTADLKAGAVWSLYNIPQDRRLNHRMEVVDGVLREECSELLTSYFSGAREQDEPDPGGD